MKRARGALAVFDLARRRGSLCAVAAAAIATLAAPTASAQPVEKGSFGLGVVVGSPLGISGKLYLSDDTAVDAMIGSDVVSGGIQVHADYLIHPFILEQRDSFVMPVYLGAGALVIDRQSAEDGSEFHVGLRLVIGMLFDFTEVPLDVFVEAAGVGDYTLTDPREFGLGINAGVGARYYF